MSFIFKSRIMVVEKYAMLPKNPKLEKVFSEKYLQICSEF